MNILEALKITMERGVWVYSDNYLSGELLSYLKWDIERDRWVEQTLRQNAKFADGGMVYSANECPIKITPKTMNSVWKVKE